MRDNKTNIRKVGGSMLERILTGIVVVFGFGLSLFLIKKWINDLSKDVKELTNKHQLCREDLPKAYADKKETNRSFRKLWEKVDEHTSSISRLVGRLNGGGAG